MVAAFHRQIVLKYDKLIKDITMEQRGTFPLPKSLLIRSSASERLRQLCWQRRGVSPSIKPDRRWERRKGRKLCLINN